MKIPTCIFKMLYSHLTLNSHSENEVRLYEAATMPSEHRAEGELYKESIPMPMARLEASSTVPRTLSTDCCASLGRRIKAFHHLSCSSVHPGAVNTQCSTCPGWLYDTW